MAEDHVPNRKLFEHAGCDLTGERPVVVLVHVLRAETDVAIKYLLGHLAQGRKRRAHDNIHFLHVGQFALQPAHQVKRLGHGFVHLPVAGDDELAFLIHDGKQPNTPKRAKLPNDAGPAIQRFGYLRACVFGLHLSVNAATPGNTAPSRDSKLAPPPVLMNVTLSPSPAWFSALTLSPPPMMLFAPLFCVASATARAIAVVPSAKRLSSKMPIGPFHRIVFALAISAAYA